MQIGTIHTGRACGTGTRRRNGYVQHVNGSKKKKKESEREQERVF
jgi:hypothetical protein